jgi:hypothetical protein
MSQDEPDEISLDDIERMLRTYEGEPTPRVRPAQARASRIDRRAIVIIVAVAAAAAVAASVVLVLEHGSTHSDAALGPAVCRLALTFRGVRYLEVRLSSETLVRQGRRLGLGSLGGCAAPRKSVEVHALRGIDAHVAIGRRAYPGLLYLATGHCGNARSERELLACIRRTG